MLVVCYVNPLLLHYFLGGPAAAADLPWRVLRVGEWARGRNVGLDQLPRLQDVALAEGIRDGRALDVVPGDLGSQGVRSAGRGVDSPCGVEGAGALVGGQGLVLVGGCTLVRVARQAGVGRVHLAVQDLVPEDRGGRVVPLALCGVKQVLAGGHSGRLSRDSEGSPIAAARLVPQC